MMKITINFYGERVVVCTRDRQLASQITANFHDMVADGTWCGNDCRGDIEVGWNPGEPADMPFADRWAEFSVRFVRSMAHRFVFVHAAGVAHAGTATLFAGPSRSGKTTLSLAAAQMGLQVLGDDVVAVEWRTGRVYAVPFPFRPRPDTHDAARFGEVAGEGRRAQAPRSAEAPVVNRVALLGPGEPASHAAALSRLVCSDGTGAAVSFARLVGALRGACITRIEHLPPVGRDLGPQKALLEQLVREHRHPNEYETTGFEGYSMWPVLRPGDRVLWRRRTADTVPAPGDVVRFRRGRTLVAHRVVSADSNSRVIRTRGDANLWADAPVGVSSVSHVAAAAWRGTHPVRLEPAGRADRFRGIVVGQAAGVAWRMRAGPWKRMGRAGGLNSSRCESPGGWHARASQARRALDLLDTVFAAESIEYLPLKGADLAARGLADRIASRTMSDIDILVRPCDFARASGALAAMPGARRAEGHWPFEHEYAVVVDGAVERIELHSALNYPERFDLPAGDLFARAVRVSHTRFLTDATDALLVTVAHALVHAAASFDNRCFGDIAALAQCGQVDWHAFCQRAERAGLWRFSSVIMRYAARAGVPQVPGDCGSWYAHAVTLVPMGAWNRMPQFVRRVFLEAACVRDPVGLLLRRLTQSAVS